jgi:hypothetical protein
MQYVSISHIETLAERKNKVLLVQTEQVITPNGIWPPVVHLIKNPKKVREIVGNKLISSIQWMDSIN